MDTGLILLLLCGCATVLSAIVALAVVGHKRGWFSATIAPKAPKATPRVAATTCPPPPPVQPVRAWCEYATRGQLPNGCWQCPAGYEDTGRNWGMPDPQKQCVKAGCPATAPRAVAAGSSVAPVGPADPCPSYPQQEVRKWCQYTVREHKPGAACWWTCPAGFSDTGRQDGNQCVKDGCPATAPADPCPSYPQQAVRGWCQYTVREHKPGAACWWTCPAGFSDTGRQDGNQCVKDGCPATAPAGLGPAALGAAMVNLAATQTMGVDAEAVSNILSMINGPEQSRAEWWLRDNGSDVWGYCSNIGDGRGCTVGIAGFTTGDGDMQRVLDRYKAKSTNQFNGGNIPRKECCGNNHPTENHPNSACDFCGWVAAAARDQRFLDAQWEQYAASYMSNAVSLAPPGMKTNALVLGMILDAAMNAGMDDDPPPHGAWGAKSLATKNVDTSSPMAYVVSFVNNRKAHKTYGTPGIDDRANAWLRLAQAGRWSMKGFDIRPYVYIPR